jgi:hypothetical protein
MYRTGPLSTQAQNKMELENKVTELQQKIDMINETHDNTVAELKVAFEKNKKVVTTPIEDLKLEIECKDKELEEIRLQHMKHLEMLVVVHDQTLAMQMQSRIDVEDELTQLKQKFEFVKETQKHTVADLKTGIQVYKQAKTDLEYKLTELQRKFDMNDLTIVDLKAASEKDKKAVIRPIEKLQLQIECQDKELEQIRVEKRKHFEILVKVRADLEKATAQV